MVVYNTEKKFVAGAESVEERFLDKRDIWMEKRR